MTRQQKKYIEDMRNCKLEKLYKTMLDYNGDKAEGCCALGVYFVNNYDSDDYFELSELGFLRQADIYNLNLRSKEGFFTEKFSKKITQKLYEEDRVREDYMTCKGQKISSIAALNDYTDLSFKEMADIIEENHEEIFVQ